MRRLGVGCLAVIGAGVLLVILIAALSSGGASVPGGSSAATVRVSGVAGQAFSCALQGGSSSRSVDGTVPAEYPVEGAIVGAVCQKKSAGPELLKVELVRGGAAIASSETTAAYGVASATK